METLLYRCDRGDSLIPQLWIVDHVERITGARLTGDAVFGCEGVRGADVGMLQPGDFDGFGEGVGLRMGGECAIGGCLCVAPWESGLDSW